MEVLENQQDVVNFVKDVAEKQGLINPTITNVGTNQKGEGYLGQIYMITIQDSKSKLELVVKAAFTDEKIRKFVPIASCFQNEIYFYSEVYPFFQKFEKECGILSQTELVPRCFDTLKENAKEMLCLENLKHSGFELFEKTKILDHGHVSLIFETYGRFHAYSFALKDQKPEDFARISSKLQNIYGMFFETPQSQFSEHLQQLINLVETYFSLDEEKNILEEFEKYKGSRVVDHYLESIEDSDYPVILHGDCWSNNMMFKYEVINEKKKPVEMRLLDIQLIKLGSPVCDLSYFLYSGASKKIYDKLETYLKIYHDSLSSFLHQLGSDPEKIFPFGALKDQWKKYAKFGMIQSLTILKMKATKQEDIEDLQDLDENNPKSFFNIKFDEEVYKTRVKELLMHLSEIGAL